jgi:hypothetical protein
VVGLGVLLLGAFLARIAQTRWRQASRR